MECGGAVTELRHDVVEVILRRARLVLGWMTALRWYTISVCNKVGSALHPSDDSTSALTVQVKLSELERKYDIQVARHEQLTREMNQLRQLAPAPPPPPPPPCAARCAGAAAQCRPAAAAAVGQFQVYVARYSYDPVMYSPNDNPEAELRLSAGDYLFIYGDVDEVGRQRHSCRWGVAN